MPQMTHRVEFDPNIATIPDTSVIKTGIEGNVSFSLDYHEFQEGVSERGIYLGLCNHECIDMQTGDLKVIQVAVWVTEITVMGTQVKVFRKNGSVRLVDALKNQEQGFAFSATKTGSKAKGTKQIAQFHIVKLTAQ